MGFVMKKRGKKEVEDQKKKKKKEFEERGWEYVPIW